MSSATGIIFKALNGFCSDCGSILPLVKEKGDIICYTCGKTFKVEVFGDMEVNFTIHFNNRESTIKNNEDIMIQKDKEGSEEGPVVDRRCPKCDNDKMSYATVQLRSADEGQTVFFTCTNCSYKESENS